MPTFPLPLITMRSISAGCSAVVESVSVGVVPKRIEAVSGAGPCVGVARQVVAERTKSPSEERSTVAYIGAKAENHSATW